MFKGDLTDTVSKAFKQVYGKPCWGVEYDRNVNLSMSFGDPILKIREPIQSISPSNKIRELFARRHVTVKGKWWLWIFCAYWKLSFDGERAASGTSSFRQIQIGLAKLSGQILKQVEINPQTGATRFVFDLGGLLEVRRFERDSKEDLWMLYAPNGNVLTVRSDGQFSYQLANDQEERLLPLRVATN